MTCREKPTGNGTSEVENIPNNDDSLSRFWDLGYAAARRGELESPSLYHIDKHSRRAYDDGYAAYLEKARRNHREDTGLVD